ncbi:MAG: VWA domain-containing protein [Candidatus Pacearchaeota archaeon]
MFLIYFFSFYYSKKKPILFSNFKALERVFGVEYFSKSFINFFMEILIVFLLISSLAQPVISYKGKASEFSYVILVDVSRSMEVEDVGMSRLEMAKKIAKNFVDSMPPGSEFGVVAFAGDVRVIKRVDSSSLKTKMAIDSLEISNVEGSNVVNAIVSSVSLFGNRGKKGIFLLSDGEFGLENSSIVLGYVEANNVAVNSVIIGKDGGKDSFGRTHGKNEEVLKALSFTSGGNFFDSSKDLRSIKEVFVESEREINLFIDYYLILLALVLFFVLWIFRNFGISF